MPLFGLAGVWLIVFGNVQSEFPSDNGLLSDVDVKNLFQRLILLEESLKAEKERNDELERKVNSLETNLEQTKRTFEDKFAALEKQLQEHQDLRKKDLSNVHHITADKIYKRETYQKDDRNKRTIDWRHLWYSASENRYLNTARRGSKEISFTKRLLIQPNPVTPTVAFYAQISSNIPESVATENHVLVYNTLKTNDGNGYHPSTGVFIVPETGIYVFSWSFRNGFGHYHSTQLMVNNDEEGVIHLHPNSGATITGTGLAVLHVNKGDDVYVRIKSGTGVGGILYNDTYGKSWFAGWKLN